METSLEKVLSIKIVLMLTVIHVLFAVLSLPAGFAFARVVVHQVGTLAVVQAWR